MGIVGWVRPWMAAVAAVATALCLLTPWAGSGQVDRSTIELLGSAGALDLLEGRNEVIALAGWFAVPLLAAMAAVGAGWGRRRLTAWSALPMGPVMVMAWWAVASSPLEARWGAVLSALVGLMASSLAGLVLMSRDESAEGQA